MKAIFALVVVAALASSAAACNLGLSYGYTNNFVAQPVYTNQFVQPFVQQYAVQQFAQPVFHQQLLQSNFVQPHVQQVRFRNRAVRRPFFDRGPIRRVISIPFRGPARLRR